MPSYSKKREKRLFHCGMFYSGILLKFKLRPEPKSELRPESEPESKPEPELALKIGPVSLPKTYCFDHKKVSDVSWYLVGPIF